MTGDAPSLGRSSDGFGVPCSGNHFNFLTMDTFLTSHVPPPASSTLTTFFNDNGKGPWVASCG